MRHVGASWPFPWSHSGVHSSTADDLLDRDQSSFGLSNSEPPARAASPEAFSTAWPRPGTTLADLPHERVWTWFQIMQIFPGYWNYFSRERSGALPRSSRRKAANYPRPPQPEEPADDERQPPIGQS